MNLRAIVVDDSIVFRKVIRDAIAQIDGVDVIDVARDGASAIEKIKRHRPEVVTLDLEMPGLSGLEVLESLQREHIETNVIMVSSHTQRGAVATTKALEMGAFDYILKPDNDDAVDNQNELRQQLASRLDFLIRPAASSTARANDEASPQAPQAGTSESSNHCFSSDFISCDPVDAICIGISTGGPKALARVIPSLSSEINIPILIVQHMPPMFTETMARSLNERSSLAVVEATDGMPLRGGQVYIAPGGKQTRVGGYPGAWTIEVTNDDAIRSCKPSVDYLLNSAAHQFHQRLLAIVMTGMGDDGLAGCRTVAAHGGQVWAQDQVTSTVFGMPRQIIEAGLANEILPLDLISQGIEKCGCQAGATLT